MTIRKAALDGSRRELLRAMAGELATRLDESVPAAYLAPIARTLREIDQELRDLDRAATDEVSRAAAIPDTPWPD